MAMAPKPATDFGLLKMFFAIEIVAVGCGEGCTGERAPSTPVLFLDAAKPEVVVDACDDRVDESDDEVRGAVSFSMSYEAELPGLAVEACEESRLRALAGD
jgi:hypothetical protein